MTGAAIAYFAARVLTCGIWISAGLHKAFHYRANLAEMAHLCVPLPRVVLPLVLVLEGVGSAMLIFDYGVWLACLAWLVFLVPASYLYHFKFMVQSGAINFPQLVTGWKNVSIAGGLLALILTTRTRPTRSRS